MGKNLKGIELGKGLTQRKDGRYEARAMLNGVKICLYNNNLKELKKNFEEEKQRIVENNMGYSNSITLKEWYEIWFKNTKAPSLKTETSVKVYNRKISNTYINILGSKKMVEIQQMDIQLASNELFQNGYKTRSIKEALGVLKECFNIAIINHITTTNPCIGITVQNDNIVPKDKRVLTIKEQKIFLDETDSGYYREVYRFLLCTGLRIGEFAGLQWQDINFYNKTITINRSMQTSYLDGKKIEQLTSPKTRNAYRTIPFFGEVEGLLKTWKNKQISYKKQLGDRWRLQPEFGDLVFTNSMGSPITRYVLAHDINKVVKDINAKEIYNALKEGRQPIEFKGVHPHTFRHTFATRCFEKGLDPIFVQKIMGHANYATTVGYTHLLDGKQQEQVVLAGNFLE